ncbi:unnamed protein product [Symbiodinium sp. CCMP2592]|nr:unnamed protein product [Symbiodinium sp. CCMP2592]
MDHFHPLLGRRIGEAQNPGPAQQTDLRDFFPRPLASQPLPHQVSDDQSPASQANRSCVSDTAPEPAVTVRIAVINPTAILHKDRELLDLDQDIVLASETSAVAAAQRIVAHKLRPAGFTTVWSAPVAPHQSQREHRTTLRGHASGVALFSRFPARKSFVPLEAQVDQSARLLESHVRVGHFEFRAFVVYGFPANYQDAGSRNAALLQDVLRRLLDCPVPAIVGGDFNTDVTTLPEFDLFRQLGFTEADHYWQQRTGELLPPTCKNATRHDTMLLPGVLLPFVRNMCVATDLHFFDSHAPFLAEFRLPNLARHQGQVQAAIASSRTSDGLDAAFVTWASANEAAVDEAVRAAHAEAPGLCPARSLPRSAKGRCAYRPLQRRPYARSAPQGRSGDYTPSCEAVTVVARANVRQVRRLATFVQGLAKVAAVATLPSAVQAQLSQEWAAITRGRGFAPSFPSWLLQCPHFDTYWSSLPPLEWAREVLQYVRFDAEAHVRAEADHRHKLARFQVHQDSTSGCSRSGFRNLRPQPRPPFLCIPYEENQTARLIRLTSPDTGLYSVQMPRFVRIGQTAQLDDVPVTVEALTSDEQEGSLLLLRASSANLPGTARFTQASCAAQSDKGPARTDPAHWATFLDTLPPAPPAASGLSIDMQDVQLWSRQIRRLKSGGFSPEELKCLPPASVDHLAQLFAKCTLPRPRSTVHVLAKVDEPSNIGQGRPITVYATIYRLWSSVAARSILRQWVTWMPESVRGCIPGRGVREISIVIQVMIESALQSGRALGGFSLDIVKCFNQLPRLPLRRLLLHLHVPSDIVEIWFQFLDCNTRFALFHGELGTPVASTTGAPEGDPMSVVGQIAQFAGHLWRAPFRRILGTRAGEGRKAGASEGWKAPDQVDDSPEVPKEAMQPPPPQAPQLPEAARPEVPVPAFRPTLPKLALPSPKAKDLGDLRRRPRLTKRSASLPRTGAVAPLGSPRALVCFFEEPAPVLPSLLDESAKSPRPSPRDPFSFYFDDMDYAASGDGDSVRSWSKESFAEMDTHCHSPEENLISPSSPCSSPRCGARGSICSRESTALATDQEELAQKSWFRSQILASVLISAAHFAAQR